MSPAHLGRLRRLDVARRCRDCLSGTVRVEPGLLELVPFALVPSWVPGHIGSDRNPMLATIFPPLRRTLRRVGFERVELLVIDQPLLAGIWEYMEARTIVYRPTDVFPLLMANPSVARLERRILDVSHVVLGASQPVLDHVEAIRGRSVPALLLENGVEYDRFAAGVPPPPEYAAIMPPRAVYVGSLDRRFDWDAVVAGATALPWVQFVLIGPLAGRPAGVRGHANVHLLGPRSYRLLPSYLQHADAALLPMNNHPVNEGRSPNKLYEYLAAGLEVVARDTAELARRQEPFVSLYRTPRELPQVLEALLARGPDGGGARASAREHCWRAVSERALHFIRSAAS